MGTAAERFAFLDEPSIDPDAQAQDVTLDQPVEQPMVDVPQERFSFLDEPADPNDRFAFLDEGTGAVEPIQFDRPVQPFGDKGAFETILDAVGDFVVETIIDVGNALDYGLRDAYDRARRTQGLAIRPSGVALPPQDPLAGRQSNTDPTRPIVTPEYQESHGEFIVRRSAEGDREAQRQLESVMRGTAFVGGFLPTSLAAGVASRAGAGTLTTFLRSTGGLMATEALGGSIYGGIRPLEEGETRAGAIGFDAVSFGVSAGVLSLALRGLGRIISGKPKPEQEKIKQEVQRRFQETMNEVAAQGTNPAALPQEVRDALVMQHTKEVLEQTDNRVIDIDAVARAARNIELEKGRIASPLDDIQQPQDLVLEGASREESRILNPQQGDRPEGIEYGAGLPARIIYDENGPGLTLQAFRGTPTDPTELGHGGAIFMSDDPAYSALFADSQITTGILKRPRLHRVEYQFEEPKIVTGWSDLRRDAVEWDRMGPEVSGEIRKTADRFIAGESLTPDEFTSIKPYVRNQERIFDDLRSQGHDGLVVVDSEGATMEIMSLQPGRVKSVAEWTPNEDDVFDMFFPGHTQTQTLPYGMDWDNPETRFGLSYDEVFSEFRHYVEPLLATRTPIDEALEVAASTRYKTQFPVQVDFATPPNRSVHDKAFKSVMRSVIDFVGEGGYGFRGDVIPITPAAQSSIAHYLERVGSPETYPLAYGQVSREVLFAARETWIFGSELNPAAREQLEFAVGDALRRYAVEHPSRGSKESLAALDAVISEVSDELVPHIQQIATSARKVTDQLHDIARQGRIRQLVEQVDPTISRVDPGRPQGFQSFVMDAGIERALDNLDPRMISTDEVNRAIAAADRLEPRRIGDVNDVLEQALRTEPSAAEVGLSLHLTGNQPLDIPLQTLTSGPPTGAKARVGKKKPPIEFDAFDMVKATPFEAATGTADEMVPKTSGWKAAQALDTQEQLDKLTQAAQRILNDKGAAQHALVARLALAGVGATLETAAFTSDEDAFTRTALGTVGGYLLAASAMPFVKQWALKTGFTRRVIHLYSPESLLSGGTKEAVRTFRDTMSGGRVAATVLARDLAGKFSKLDDDRLMLRLFDQGAQNLNLSPLSQEQINIIGGVRTLHNALVKMIRNEGALTTYVERFMRRALPESTYNAWLTNGYKRIIRPNGQQVRRRILSLEEVDNWARQNGLPTIDKTTIELIPEFIQDAYTTLAHAQVKNSLIAQGAIQRIPKNGVVPNGWEALRTRIPGSQQTLQFSKAIAPTDLAAALRTIDSPRASDNDILNALDVTKAWWMRSIMFWFWEHGVNALRAVPLISFNPARYAHAVKQVARNDPAMVEAARYGLNLFDRPDFALEAQRALEKTLGNIGSNVPTLNNIRKIGSKFIHWQDRLLWERMMPSIAMMGYNTQMLKWANRTGGRFGKGSPEYIAAARAAADFGNKITGRVPQELINPAFARTLRLILFSPNWSLSRASMIAHAAGELGEIVAGRLNPLDATYLPMKMRQAAVLAATTWVGSKLISGEEPEWNPRNIKFYMRTGLKNDSGREIGVDLAGWWQDDFKFFNAPITGFLANRLNPSFKASSDFIAGRDFFGNKLTQAERWANLARSFGPPTAVAETLMRGAQAATGGVPITGAEVVQRSSEILAFGNVSSLPSQADIMIGKLARRLLKKAHIPASEDRIFELSRILRSNALSGQPLIDNSVMFYLSGRQRSGARREPAVHLWEQTKRLIPEF